MQGNFPEVSKAVQAAELAAADGEDPLDAFMAQEILPEVKQKEQQEAARKEEERKALAQQLAVGLTLILRTLWSSGHQCLALRADFYLQLLVRRTLGAHLSVHPRLRGGQASLPSGKADVQASQQQQQQHGLQHAIPHLLHAGGQKIAQADRHPGV